MKVPKRRWTKEELELLQQGYADPEQRAVLPELLGRSLSAIRDKAHRLRKTTNGQVNGRVRRRMQRPNQPTANQPVQDVGDLREELARVKQEIEQLRNQFSDVKYAFEELADQLQAHMKSFGMWLIEIGEAYIHGVRPVSMHDVMAENRKLKFEIQILQQIVRQKEELVAEQLRELELLVEQFTHLTSMQKIASLGDFLPRLRMVVGKFGEVLKAEIDVPALREVEGTAGSSSGPAGTSQERVGG